MTNTPTLWKDMTDIKKGALLLAWHEERVIEYFSCRHNWIAAEGPIGNSGYAYRIKPKAPKVETVVEYFTYFPGDGLCFATIEDSSITIAYTITDGIVTACDTIIHKNEE
jgi:hypothetical protein